MMNDSKRRAQYLCNAKNAISKALSELHNAEMEGASVPLDWQNKLREVRDKIKWPIPANKSILPPFPCLGW